MALQISLFNDQSHYTPLTLSLSSIPFEFQTRDMTFYRGCPVDLLNSGAIENHYDAWCSPAKAKQVIESSDLYKVRRLLGRHIHDSLGSPFLSLTTSPTYARHCADYKAKEYEGLPRAVYQLRILPTRVLKIPNEWQMNLEIDEFLVLGKIFDKEIVDVNYL